MQTITKNKLENLQKQHETKSFIEKDPIQFPHRFLRSGNDKNIYPDMEIAAFISACIAFGSRKAFIEKLNTLFEIMDNQPLHFVLNFNPEKLKGFKYRVFKDTDFIEVFNVLNKLYKNKNDGGLKKLFEYGYSKDKTILTMLTVVVDYFYSNTKKPPGRGFCNMIPNPRNKGAMKKMNLFLRWMVRKGPVDLGIWDFIPQSELLIPLDLHVSRLSREMGLLTRKIDDFQAVLELTENLKKFDPKDPAKFDFAIFGLGVNS